MRLILCGFVAGSTGIRARSAERERALRLRVACTGLHRSRFSDGIVDIDGKAPNAVRTTGCTRGEENRLVPCASSRALHRRGGWRRSGAAGREKRDQMLISAIPTPNRENSFSGVR